MLHWFRCDNCYSFRGEGSYADLPIKSGLASVDDVTNGDRYVKLMDSLILESRKKNFGKSDNKPVGRSEDTFVWQVATIYGPNAGGKTNYLKTMSDMFENIEGNLSVLKGKCYLLDPEIKKETIFCEMCFSLPKESSVISSETKVEYNKYRYGYTLTVDEFGKAISVSTEWLKISNIGKNNYVDVFKRLKNEIKYYGEFKEINELNEIKTRFETINNNDSTLFLRMTGESKVVAEPFSSIHEWCRTARPISLFTEVEEFWQLGRIKRLLERNPDSDFIEGLRLFIKGFDEAITNVTVENGKIMLTHISNDSFAIEDESYGTQKIIGIYQFFWDAFQNGGLLLIDELDCKLHPWVIRYFIEKFYKPNCVRNPAQLIFTSHSVSALNTKYVYSDQVYFVDKTIKGGEHTVIYRLSEDSFLNNELNKDTVNYAEYYLDKKRFGALPRLLQNVPGE